MTARMILFWLGVVLVSSCIGNAIRWVLESVGAPSPIPFIVSLVFSFAIGGLAADLWHRGDDQ
jgi:hypothetical protein